jgi:hypothetical protein
MKRPLVCAISAHVRERIVVNFAVEPDLMAAALPCDWLAPQIVDGKSVVSFCVLWLDRLTPSGWPSGLIASQISCAVRFGVIDRTTGRPGVYVVDRCTDSALGSFATRLGFPGFHPLVKFSEKTESSARRIDVERAGLPYVSFSLGAPNGSCGVFGSAHAFARFMSEGDRSYTLAARSGVLNIVDLVKEETEFVPYEVGLIDAQGLPKPIQVPCTVDSAFRAADARYEWRFVEQRPVRLAADAVVA